jgi:hypothetical protein
MVKDTRGRERKTTVKRTRWSPAEDQVMRTLYQSVPNKVIEEKLPSRSPGSILFRAMTLGLTKEVRPFTKNKQEE